MNEFPVQPVMPAIGRRAVLIGGAPVDERHLAVQPIEADVLEQWRVAVDARDDQRVAQLVQFAHALRDVGKPLYGDGG